VEITLQSGQPKTIWRTFNSILGRDRSGRLPRNTAQKFIDFFNKEVAAIQRQIAGGSASSTLPSAEVTFDTFQHCTIDDVKCVITSAVSKSCALDPLPTAILKEFLPELLPF